MIILYAINDNGEQNSMAFEGNLFLTQESDGCNSFWGLVKYSKVWSFRSFFLLSRKFKVCLNEYYIGRIIQLKVLGNYFKLNKYIQSLDRVVRI